MKNLKAKNIFIRKVTLKDFPNILSLWKKSGLEISNEEKELLSMEKTIKLNPRSCLVLVNDQKIIGSVFGAFDGRRGWIYHLAIHPDFQQNGYGSLLLQKTEKALKKLGVHRIHLGLLYKSLGIFPFYEKYGYEVVNDAIWLGKNI